MKGEKNKKGAATKYQKPSVNNTLPKLVRCYKNDDFAGFKKAYLPLQKTIKLETLRLSKKGELVIVNACLHGKLNFIQFFCQAGQVYLGGHGGAKNNSLAHYAVIGDQPEVLRLLLNLDPILLDNKDGESPLDLAMQNFKVGCIGVIIDFHYLLFRRIQVRSIVLKKGNSHYILDMTLYLIEFSFRQMKLLSYTKQDLQHVLLKFIWMI